MELKHQQKEFSQSITRASCSNQKNDIVYIDETSFHLWMSPGRLWIKQGMRVQLPDQRGQSITMIGALSIHHGLIHTEAFAGSQHCRHLSAIHYAAEGEVPRETHHSGHGQLEGAPFQDPEAPLRQHAFMAKYLPPQSCALNPIEQVWNVIKCEWKKTSYMVLDISKKKEEQIVAAVDRIQGIADGINQEKMIKWPVATTTPWPRRCRGTWCDQGKFLEK
jgi:hypothetical protein